MKRKTMGSRLSQSAVRGALLFALAALSGAGEAEARGSRARRLRGYRQVELRDVRGNPSAFIGKRVSFDCYFASLGKIYQPFWTPFVPEQYLNMHVWEPQTRLWEDTDRRSAFLFCFVPRDLDDQVGYIMNLGMYDSAKLFGRVTVVHDGKPWFEVEDVESSVLVPYQENALKHILVGIRALKAPNFKLARDAFSEALTTPMPLGAQQYVKRELGGALFKLGQYAEAAKVLEEAIALVGSEEVPDAWVALTLGQSLSRAADVEANAGTARGMLARAKKLLEDAQKREPLNAVTIAEIGWVLAKQERRDAGIVYCQRALDLLGAVPGREADRDKAAVWHILSAVYDGMNRIQDALLAAQTAVLHDALLPKYQMALGNLYRKLEDFASAERCYENVLTVAPSDVDALMERGRVRVKLMQYDRAVEDFKAAYANAPQMAEALLAEADAWARKPDYAEAERALRRAGQLGQSARVTVAEAKLLMAQRKYEEARERLRGIQSGKVTDAGEVAADVDLNLGKALLLQKAPDFSKARGHLLKAVAARPHHVESMRFLARAQTLLGDFGGAAGTLRRLREDLPTDLATRVHLAQVLAEQGDAAGAIQELKRALDDAPDSAEVKNNLAFLLAEFEGRDSMQQALTLAEEALKADESSPVYRDTYAWVLFLSDPNRAPEARAKLLTATTNAAMPDPYVHLAVVSEKNNREQAKLYLKQGWERLKAVPSKPGRLSGLLIKEAQDLARRLGETLR